MAELLGREYFAAKDREFLKEAFSAIVDEVTLTIVRKPPSRIILLQGGGGGGADDDGGELVAAVLKELATTSPKIRVVEIDAAAEPERAQALVGDLLPATVLSSANAKGKLVFYGIPAGHEMAAMISTIVELGLVLDTVPPEVGDRIRALPAPVHLKVFVTPTCPHCPAMARAAFQLAMYFPNVRADVIEIQEFPELAQQYEVRGVPKTVINEEGAIMGTVPGGVLIEAIEATANGSFPEGKQLVYEGEPDGGPEGTPV